MSNVVPFVGVPDVDSPGEVPPALSELLDRLVAFLRRYIVFSQDDQPVAVALWIVHTWVFQAFEFTPYLAIGSPVKRCGKSTLLDCLARLCREPWPVVSVSPAVLYRQIEAVSPTLLLDEVDTVFNSSKSDDSKESLRALLNAGFQRSAKVPRCVPPTHAVKNFAVFCPKALAGIGKLPDTVADRSLLITLARCAPGQKIARFRHREVSPLADELRGALEMWSQTHGLIERLSAAIPPVPDGLGDRAADICDPLLALADEAGCTWPEKARTALVRLCGNSAEESDVSVKLLRAIQAVFTDAATDRLATRDLLRKLVDREDDEPWAHWWEADLRDGKLRGPATRLARLLKPFDIFPRNFRVAKSGLVKGYMLDTFADAFVRYLS